MNLPCHRVASTRDLRAQRNKPELEGLPGGSPGPGRLRGHPLGARRTLGVLEPFVKSNRLQDVTKFRPQVGLP